VSISKNHLSICAASFSHGFQSLDGSWAGAAAVAVLAPPPPVLLLPLLLLLLLLLLGAGERSGELYGAATAAAVIGMP